MNEPPERITLALRPKPVDPAAAKHAPSRDSSTGPLPPGVDAAVYAELQQATRTYDYLNRFGDPIEFWEAVRLARSRRGVSETGEGTEQAIVADAGLAEELQVIRRQLSPMVRDLRRFLTRVPDLPPAGESLEFALGFLLASSREHQAVAKWLAESDSHLGKAAGKLRGLAAIAAPYIEFLRPWSLDGAKAAAPAAPAAPPPTPAAQPAAISTRTPPGSSATLPRITPLMLEAPAPAAPAVAIDPDVLDNFRRSTWCRRIFAETKLPAAFWEMMLFNSVERLYCKTKLATIQLAYKEQRLSVFEEETRSLHAKMIPLRTRQAPWVEALIDYLKVLPKAPKDPGLFEAAVGFSVVEPGAQDRTRKWLAAPEASAREASEHLSACIAKAHAYQAALKKPVA